MVNRLFAKNRIRGVSFRHARSAPMAGRSRRSRADASLLPWSTDAMGGSGGVPSWLGPSADQIRESSPHPFQKGDLIRLLGDYGRNELHTLVSEAVEQLGRLRQISQSIQRFSTASEPDRHFLNPENEDDESPHPMQDAGIEIMRVQRLWKLRLELLEMVAMAQDSLRSLNSKPAKRLPRPAAEFAPQRK